MVDRVARAYKSSGYLPRADKKRSRGRKGVERLEEQDLGTELVRYSQRRARHWPGAKAD